METPTRSEPSRKPGAPCRDLTLTTWDDLEREIRAIENAAEAGTLTQCGNWSPGRILGHLAAWIDYAFDGYPMNPPAFVRILGRAMKPLLMRQKRMKPGFRIRGAPAGTYGVEEMPLAEGAARLRRAVERLRNGQPGPNPIFGPLTKEEWTRMHLNHAALHLGFLKL